MPYNGVGVFSRIFNWATDKVNNVKIMASRMDSEMDGFATGLTNCVTKDGQSTTTARIPFAQGVLLRSNSLVDPGAGFFLTPTGATTSRDVSVILGETISPKHFGAVGDGTTDDTAALQLWVTRLNTVGGFGYVPPGTYKCTQRLIFTGRAVRIEGDGANTTIINFTSATPDNKGLLYLPDSGGSSYGGFAVRNLSVQTTTVGGTAIHLLLPSDGLFSTNTAVFIENATIEAPVSGYFSVGVRLYNTSNSTIENVRYTGSVTDAAAVSGYYGGIAFQIDSQTTSPSPTFGFSVENRIIACTGNFCQYGVYIGGYAKSVYVVGSNFQFVREGVSATGYSGSVMHLVCVTNCHINATDACVALNGYRRSHVTGCQLLRPDTSAIAAFAGGIWFGVHLSNSNDSTVSNNCILAEDGTAAAGAFYGVLIDGATLRAVIDSNVIIGCAANAIDIGVSLDATTTTCKVSGSNQYLFVTVKIADVGTSNDTTTFVSVDPNILTIAANNAVFSGLSTGAATLGTAINTVGFYGATGLVKQSIAGSRAGNAALADLLTKLASLGIITDTTTV